MSAKICLQLLFFYGILCQGIFATFSDNDTSSSLDFLVRKRRVINHLPTGRYSPRIEAINYLVQIRDHERGLCAGAILTRHTVITAASCVENDVVNYRVLSGDTLNNENYINYDEHTVTSKIVHYGNPPFQNIDGIALINVAPPFEFTRKTGNIRLHVGPLPVGTMVSISGWGYLYPPQPTTGLMKYRLRTITLPIMNHEECRNIYQGLLTITDKYICTYCQHQYCARGDQGAPLVLNNKLVGLHIGKGEWANQRNPDVYINLQRTDYSEWIRERIALM